MRSSSPKAASLSVASPSRPGSPFPGRACRRALTAALAWLAVGVSAPAPALAQPAAPAEVPDGPPDEEGVNDGAKTLLLPTKLAPGPAQRRPPQWLLRRARKLDALLNDAAQDLGLLVALGSEPTSAPRGEAELLATATAEQAQVLLTELTIEDPDEPTLLLRMTLAQPASNVMLSRREVTTADDLSVRATVMLRDLVVASQASGPVAARPAAPPRELAQPAHSSGRVILATNGALYGGFLGYSLQRAARSDDPRLLYPLVAVGAGAGLGAAIIVSDEWDVGVGDAWYLAAGAWWPAVAGHLIYAGRFRGTPNGNDDEPWLFGLVGSATGLTLSTVGLLSRGMDDGGAALAHSGGALGTVVGGLAEFAIRGRTDEVPFAGMGYGAGAGWLLASATAIHFHPRAGDVLAVDLGLMLGGLAGASAGSPLLFGEQTSLKTRGWVAATGAGLIGGGVVGWYLAADKPATEEPLPAPEAKPGANSARLGVPLPGMVGTSQPGEILGPGIGLQWHGQLW